MSEVADFYIKRNDTSPQLLVALKDENGKRVDISGSSVDFNMKDKNGNLIVDSQPAEIVDENNGEVKYEWRPSDTEESGIFYAEFAVDYPDTGVETFPNSTFITIKISDDIS